ncbi:bifunctional 2-polyprenyl-6-hydroxyphenol methylase/3-demethylubiquinol 3-O-methyltransferase UbiG [Accumulibacter sp.]|uniref:class I SAM-dependent methyltransferase n=1 Tax=Accumulibacter sp. TaxID=2053492 RepID=UPI0025D7A9F7|nr:methyltransferase domain-containing protein [Accumulibacter sp.]MCM8594550.1 class I SAM-dependent methyltransferase [Accumulibacter sp.]MCM8627398.1 class I SAM-dependent methyltransferase [Accumulibacter sp.]MDS4048696.1 methyltransferase domain-containing protein [Accumulibacter sp.]
MDLKETEILGASIGRHWYYRSKASAVIRLLGRAPVSTVIDVGAGSGFFSRYLLCHTSAREAWCIDTSYTREEDDREGEKPIHFRRVAKDICADLVLVMDVLEHVDDDVALLRAYVNRVPPGARFVVSVPAFQFLWSGHDVFLGHRRRYRLRQIEEVVSRAGLTVRRGVYYFGAVLPMGAVLRLLDRWRHRRSLPSRSQLSQHHPLSNELLALLSRAELAVMPCNRLFGLTAFCLAEKC